MKKKTELQKKHDALKKIEETRKDLLDLAREQAYRIFKMTKNPVSAGQVYTALSIKLNNLMHDDVFSDDDYFKSLIKLFNESDKRWLGAVFNQSWEIKDYKPLGSHARRVAVWVPRK